MAQPFVSVEVFLRLHGPRLDRITCHWLRTAAATTDAGGLERRHVIMASDGGAHILSFATYGDTGYLLGHFVRDTAHLGLEAAVKKITADPASLWGLGNRGMLREGFIADITVFDEAVVDRGVEYFVQDVPGDGYRYVRDAHGIHSVVIGGALAYDKVNGYHEAHRGQIIG